MQVFKSMYFSQGFDLLCILKATLDEGPRSSVQWNRAIPLAKSHKLDPGPLDEGQDQKVANWG